MSLAAEHLSSVTTEFSIRPMRPEKEDIALYVACFNRNGSGRSFEHFRWQFLDSPPAKLNVWFAEPSGEPGRIAAIYAVAPVFMDFSDTPVLGCQSLDTLTDKDFRGKGLFVGLGKYAYAALPADGVSCVYGLPNGNSAHGFFGRLGWQSMDPVPHLARPLRSRYVLRRLTRGALGWIPDVRLLFRTSIGLKQHQQLVEVDRFTPEFDGLWQAWAANGGIGVRRDSAYLNWRIFSKPGESYRSVALREDERVAGFVTFAVKPGAAGVNGYVMELLTESGRTDIARILLRFALVEMYNGGAEVALAWNMAHSPTHPAFRACGFIPVPDSLQPIELHFGGRALDSNSKLDFRSRDRWYISYLDSDTT